MKTSTDLSTAELDELIGDGEGTHLSFVRMGLELRRRRAEALDDEERIMRTVRGILEDAARAAELVDDERPYDIAFSGRIASRVASQLAGSVGFGLSKTDYETLLWLRSQIEGGANHRTDLARRLLDRLLAHRSCP